MTHAPSEGPSSTPDAFTCEACSPLQFSKQDIIDITQQVGRDIGTHNVGIIAAGVAFFTMLAVFPLITACISIFGYLADPVQLQAQIQVLANLFPSEAWTLLNDQVMAVALEEKSDAGWRIALSLVILLWSAGAGIRAIMRAMNIAYGERERRNLAKFYGLAGLLTVSVTGFMWLAIGVIVGVPALLEFVHLEGVAAFVTRFLPWALLVGLFAVATGILYRVGPCRRDAKLIWIWPGILFATLAWLMISLGFSFFVGTFGTYNATYGSLAAVIILLVWFWLTALSVIIGALINAAMERHTNVDTTSGPDLPVGQRGAAVADYIRIAAPHV